MLANIVIKQLWNTKQSCNKAFLICLLSSCKVMERTAELNNSQDGEPGEKREKGDLFIQTN